MPESRPAPEPPPRPREWRVALAAVAAAVVAGALLQLRVPRGRCGAVAVGAAAAVLHVAVASALPARLRRALVSNEAFAAILAAVAAAGVVGTLVVQAQPEPFYVRAYGGALGGAILRLRVDDAFHSLWFAALAGVFCGSVVLSAAQRWPPSRRTLGFHLAHVGLLVAVGGAAASATLAVRGRIDLRAGETARAVAVDETAGPPRSVPLGFGLRLDGFEVERYGSELRVGFYERAEDGWRLRASFEPGPGAPHRLPDGAEFTVTALRPGPPAAAAVRVTASDGTSEDAVLLAGAAAWVAGRGAGALVLEPRPDEVKAFRSAVTAVDSRGERSAVVAVNAPFRHGGWVFYQVGYDPADPRYSGLEAVRDPGARWVFAGLALVAAGVVHALYGRAGLRRRRAEGES